MLADYYNFHKVKGSCKFVLSCSVMYLGGLNFILLFQGQLCLLVCSQISEVT
jgi:hypothetical protein